MTKKVISIEAGVWWTKVVLVDYHKKNPTVHEAFVFQTPEHTIEDGYIRDKDRFATALKEELGKRGIHEKEVIFTLSSSKVVTREVVVPFVKDNNIRGIIDSQVRDYFPMDVSDYTISFSKMGVVEEEGKKELKLLLVAIPDNLLNNYCTFADMAGLKVETFDYIGNGTIQLMSDRFLENAVVIQLEEQATVISILENKKLVFQRVTPYGYGATLTSVLEHPVLGAKDEYEAFQFLLEHNVIYNRPTVQQMDDPIEMNRRQQLAEEAYEDISESGKTDISWKCLYGWRRCTFCRNAADVFTGDFIAASRLRLFRAYGQESKESKGCWNFTGRIFIRARCCIPSA